MSDNSIRTIAIFVGGIGLNIIFEVVGIEANRIVPSFIGVVVGGIVGTVICKMRAKR